jgi:septal ring factor EnvC (AmiA/AmiB activator)
MTDKLKLILKTFVDFNEKEIVEEMIRRLQKRLDEINSREEALEAEQNQIEEDELFVNNLIKTTADKKAELDAFEAGLNKKTENLERKEIELNDRINAVMPFANAVLENEK